MPAQRFSLPRPLLTAVVATLLALHAWLAVSATIDLGVTGDETVHLTGGYSYWRFNDYRLHPENGNLPQRWAALPLLVSQPRLEPRDRPELWFWSDVWQVGQSFFFESGNSIDYLLLCARSMMVFWSVATGLLVFAWSRSLWGDAGGLFSLILFAMSPTTLAHGALVTSDMCATFWLLAATGAWWRVTSRVTAPRLCLSLAAFALAAVAKFSAILLLPIGAVILVWRAVHREPLEFVLPKLTRGRACTRTGQKLAVFGALGTVHIIVAAAAVWSCFGFRYHAFNVDLPRAADFYASADGVLPAAGAYRWAMLKARHLHLLPEAYLQGFAYVVYAAKARASFLAGEYSISGWWWYFPFAFLVKSSLAELTVACSLPFMAWSRWRAARRDLRKGVEACFPLITFAIVYGAASLTSHLNIGQRHILPLYPILFIMAGALLSRLPTHSRALREPAAPGRSPRSWQIGLIGAALIGAEACVETAAISPDYLAYFNLAAGGPENGRRLLGDSSLDWGQNLPRLADWLNTHRQPGEQVYVSSFGADDPFYRGIGGIELSPYYTFGRQLKWEPLTPGLYCVGASMLQDAASPYAGPWTRQREAAYQYLKHKLEAEIAAGLRAPSFKWDTDPKMELWNLDRARFARLCSYLRVRAPDAVIGRTILVFRLSELEVTGAVQGTLPELVTLLEQATSQFRR
jgi:hypothetical protein